MARAIAEKKLAPAMSSCTCARIGYAMFLCQDHAPIPFELTDRGRRDARRMRKWDAMFETLVERERDNPRAQAARKAWITRRKRGRA